MAADGDMTRVRSAARLAAGLYALVLLILSLWPFNFQTRCAECENGAEATSSGLGFAEEGVVIDEGAGPALHDRLAGGSSISVVVDMESYRFFQQGPARIVSFSRDAGARNFTIGQQRDALAFRLRTPGTGENGSKPATMARWTIRPGERRVFTATYDGAAFRIFADGALAAERRMAAGGFDTWSRDHTLLFGNETNGDRPWRGRLYEVAIYDRALSADEAARLIPGAEPPEEGRIYRLTERCGPAGACSVPATYMNDHDWRMLAPGVRAPSDYGINAALWATLGALIAFAFAPRLLWPLGAAALLALAVELGQAPLHARTSSLFDLIAAWGGLALAAALARRRLVEATRRPEP